MAKDTKPVSVERTITIKNKLGMHARAAALFRECASRYQSDVLVVKNHVEANAKSLLGLIALGAAKGTVLKIIATGDDAEAALESLASLVDRLFDEKE